MQRLFSSFPSGMPGLALLLLRFSTASTLVLATLFSERPPGSPASIAAAFLLTVGLCVGLWTPALCVLAVLVHCFLHNSSGSFECTARLILDIAPIVSLALLGPGAYSCDAKRFGRRVVVLPK